MEAKFAKTALTATAVAMAMALAACGDRSEQTVAESAQPSVEINRQGMEGAKEENMGVGVQNDGNVRSLGAKGDTSVMDPDVLLAERVKAALASSPETQAADIAVQTDEGDVTLQGRAPDQATRERATEIARGITDVRSVDNQMTLG